MNTEKPKGLGLLIALGKPKEAGKMHQEKSMGMMDMENAIPIPETAYPDAKDGDMVTTEVSGKIMVHDDGSRYIKPESINGSPIPSMEEDEGPEMMEPEALNETSEENESGENEGDNEPVDSSMRADEAFDVFMKKRNKKKIEE